MIATSKLSDSNVLKTGQIVQGKILKLYPNNKALIQLGTDKMTAQLEASLMTGGRYHFQVQFMDDVIHLKVLGEQLHHHLQTNAQNLMRQLGLKTTTTSGLFMQQLLKEKIPFAKDQLIKVIQLLEGAKNKPLAQEVLKEMIVQRLPITQAIFDALYTKNTSSFSEQIKSLLQQLNLSETTSFKNIENQLQQMIKRPLQSKMELIRHMSTEAINNNRQVFNLLKTTGIIEASLKFTTWKSHIEAYTEQNHWTQLNMPHRDATALKLPLKIEATEIKQVLKKVVENKGDLNDEAQKILRKFGEVMHQTIINHSTLDTKEFTLLKQQIIENLLPLLSRTQQIKMASHLLNTPLAIEQILQSLQTLADGQTYHSAEKLLRRLQQSETFLSMTPKEQFLTHLKHVLLFTGLTHENLVKQDLIQQQTATIKSMLIQMTQQSEGINQERMQQLLHFINGLQLQSVNETSNLIQASLQIPGEKLNLNSDLRMELEGEKTEDGMVNPDHCRILFYLDLENLKETVIDMHIQKRTVAVTIFNDEERMRVSSSKLQTMLKEALTKLDYHLTTLTMKPLQQDDKPKKNRMTPINQSIYQGVDYRI